MANNTINNNNEIDPFDEFEFKPLTEGLGFHKKSNSQASADSATSKVNFKSSHMQFNNSPSPLSPPLPRAAAATETKLTSRPTANATPNINVPTIEDDSILKAQSAVNEILKNLNHKKQQDEILNKNKKVYSWKDSAPSLAAAGLDFMIIAALFLVGLIAMISITKADLVSNILNPGNDYSVWMATGLLFFISYFSYMVLFRSYMNFTLGEWAFDQRCGTTQEIGSSWYAPKVIFRTIVIAATGFLTLPVISFLFRKDIAGQISGAHIQKLTV